LEKEQRILFWFPLVGSLFGLFFIGVSLLPFSVQVRSALIIALSAYLSRGFHLDGLCDFADGLGGGWNKERSLAIMKDSHSGAFALITLFCVLLIQYAALQQLSDIPLALMLVPVLGRLNQVIAASLMNYAREGEGTASRLVRAAKPYHLVLPLMQILIALALLLVFSNEYALNAVSSFLFALLVCFFLMLVSKKRLGGVTGDVLGALELLTETASMLGFILPLASGALPR